MRFAAFKTRLSTPPKKFAALANGENSRCKTRLQQRAARVTAAQKQSR